MGGKAYRQDTRIHKIFKGPVEAKKVFFKDTEVFSSSHDVAYHADVHNIIMKEIEDETDIISQAPVVTKTGWIFVRWRLDAEPDPEVLIHYLATEDDIHVYAVFEKDVNLTLVGGENTLYQSGTRYYNNGNYRNPIITLETATLPDWTLVGYRLDTQPDATVPYYGGQAYAFAEDTTLYTVFKQTVTLRVLIKGTTYTYPRTRYVNNENYDNPVVYVDDQTLDDAVFDGYSDDPSSTSIAIATLSEGYTLTEDAYFYAVWTYNNRVLSTSYIERSRDGAGSVTFLTLDTTKYDRLQVTVQAFASVGGWAAQCNVMAYLGGTYILHASRGSITGDWEEGPCANGAVASVTVNTPVSTAYNLNASWSGDCYQTQRANIRRVEGLGRTTIY